MNPLIVATAVLLVAQTAPSLKERERHPLAPSLPLLTKAESDKVDAAIERLIKADTGKITGADAKKALDDFNRLGPEATFNLIDGLNRTANMESSCPAVIIAKRLASIFLSTEDMELLTFAKENIGAGVTAKRHLNVLKDLQVNILLRKGALQRRALAAGPKLGSMSLADLEKGVAKESGPKLQALLAETEKRPGAKAVDILLMGIASPDKQIAKLSMGMLDSNLQRQSGDVLKTMLKHDRREVRLNAAKAVAAKKLRFGAELIDLLKDGDTDIRQAARHALMQIANGADYGPSADASFNEREMSIEQWLGWWKEQK